MRAVRQEFLSSLTGLNHGVRTVHPPLKRWASINPSLPGRRGAGPQSRRAITLCVSHSEYSQHAVDQTTLRHIAVQELREAIANGEVIEDYPNDKYGPSCLVLGFTDAGRPIHVQCSHPSRSLIKIITAYQPDPDEWDDFKHRRS